MSEHDDDFWFWVWLLDGLPGAAVVVVLAVALLCWAFGRVS